MLVSISDYRNIKQLSDLEIDEGKINFLTGMSGTGKTAIVRAIEGDSDELDARAGSEKSPVIKCEPQPNAVDVFDRQTVEDLYLEEQSATAFSVVMLKSASYKQAEQAYYESIAVLRQHESNIRKQHARYTSIIEQTKAKFKKDGDLTQKCNPMSAAQAVDDSSPERLELVKKRGGDYLSWLHEGTRFEEWTHDAKRCPFCQEGVKDERVEFINLVASDNGKDIAKIKTLSESLSANGIEVGDLFVPDNMRKAIDVIMHANQALEAYSRLLKIIEYGTRGIRQQSHLCEEDYAISPFFDEVPGLVSALEELAKSDREFKKASGVLSSEFENTIDSNKRMINCYLTRFDIPYRFEVVGINDDDKAEYHLVHVDSAETKDYKVKLSYGERNVIALLLFLLKPHEQGELIVIDDPVSSYDEFRRVLVYRMLFELDLQNTVLLLSHDHVFAKYALFFRDKAMRKASEGASMSQRERACFERSGRIVYLENYGGDLIACELKKEDYGTLQQHVLERLKQPDLTIRQKVINLRMYAETIQHDEGLERAVYGYLSALLHHRADQDTVSIIEERLGDDQYNESEIIAWIYEEAGVSFPKLESIDPASLLDETNMRPFERLVALRESVHDDAVKAELNDMVHLNTALVHCLNPYAFIPCSNKARRLLASSADVLSA